ncbi:MAG: cupin domain-containing protein [Gemmatimonadaceae bacterium]
MAGLVDIQAGAVVSRALVKRPTGTVTLFAIDAGEGLSEHMAPFEALLIGVEGSAEVSMLGAVHVVKAGDLLRLPPRAPHALHALTPFKMLLVMMRDPAPAP